MLRRSRNGFVMQFCDEFVSCHTTKTLHSCALPLLWLSPAARQEEQLQLPHHPHIPLASPIVFADGAHLIAEAYVRDHPFSADSRATQFGASAWFISVAFWVCLELI